MEHEDKRALKRERREAREYAKRIKREAKKATRKAEARTKVRMEVVRTFGSAGSFMLGAVAFLRAYQII